MKLGELDKIANQVKRNNDGMFDVPLSREYPSDIEYNSLMRIRKVSVLSQGLDDIGMHIAELKSLREAGLSAKWFLHRIQMLEYKQRNITKLHNALVKTQVRRIMNKIEERKENIALAKLMDMQLKRSNFDKPINRERTLINGKSGTSKTKRPPLTAKEMLKITIEESVKHGMDINDIPRDKIIEAGLEHLLPLEATVTEEYTDNGNTVPNYNPNLDLLDNLLGFNQREADEREERLKQSIGKLSIEIEDLAKGA